MMHGIIHYSTDIFRNAGVDRHHYAKDGYCVIIRTAEAHALLRPSLEVIIQCPDETSAKKWHSVCFNPLTFFCVMNPGPGKRNQRVKRNTATKYATSNGINLTTVTENKFAKDVLKMRIEFNK